MEDDRIRKEKWEDRKRRMRDPNYIPTVEDKIDDAVGMACAGVGFAKIAYGVFRMLRWVKMSGY